jgi:hypothetical protein
MPDHLNVARPPLVEIFLSNPKSSRVDGPEGHPYASQIRQTIAPVT